MNWLTIMITISSEYNIERSSLLILFIIIGLILKIQQCNGELFDMVTNRGGRVPIIINTWAFDEANQAGWSMLRENGSALDAIVAACSKCETLQCYHTVGWGGNPDEIGETTLDAMIMDGLSHKAGSVGALRQVKNAIGVARAILDHSTHTMLVGSQATEFALEMGFIKENLSSEWSIELYDKWKSLHCQPNYRINVEPDPRNSCGPYRPKNDINQSFDNEDYYRLIDETNHDTIGAVAIDFQGRIASGTSTNGMKHKIPGRIGDSPIPGAGSYADQEAGGAAATGDGDIIMRFLSSYQAVENLRNGMGPRKAAQESLNRILKKYPKAQVGIVVLDIQGNYGAACINIDGGFPFIVRSAENLNQTKHLIKCDKKFLNNNNSPIVPIRTHIFILILFTIILH